MDTRLLAAIAGTVITSATSAQWTQVGPTAAPAARAGAAMAGNFLADHTLLFAGVGGTGLGTYFSDTWSYDGTAWNQLSPAVAPPARLHMDMVFDFWRGVFVLYGGQSTGGGAALNQTWEFDGVNWTQRSTATVPGNLCLHAMAFDGIRGKVVLYGGYPGGFPAIDNNRTWEYDGTNWTQRFPSTNPGAREAMSMCFHTGVGKTILFGGVDATPSTPPNLVDNDKTWAFDGINWTELVVTGTRPPRRERARMAYDSVRGVCVLTGGMHYSNGASKSDTWELRQTGATWSWVQVNAPTVARYGSTLAFLSGSRHMVQFGGVTGSSTYFGDTREYGAQGASFGVGCAGANGVPMLTANDAPRIGLSYTLNVTNLDPTINFAILVFGFSQVPGGIDLGALLGMTGCTGYQPPDLMMWPPVGTGGAVNWSWTPDAGLFGLTFYGQALCADPPANTFGWTISNAVSATVGN